MREFNRPQPEPALDKFQIATARLIDTLHGYFAGNHPASNYDNVRAVCELVFGIMTNLQKKGLIDSDLPHIYKQRKDIGDNPGQWELVSADMHDEARTGSNKAKHADRDADTTYQYNDTYDFLHFLYSMAQDYETLHSELMSKGLLDRSHETLYPIPKAWFVEHGSSYRVHFHPSISGDRHPSRQQNPTDMFDLVSGVLTLHELREDQSTVDVPAATAACMIFYQNSFATVSRHNRSTVAEKIRSLGIWPVDTKSNAMLSRNHGIVVDPEHKPEA